MSAINPASFVTPTSSLNVPPPFVSNGTQGGRGSPAGRRRHQGHTLTPSSAGGYAEPTDGARSSAATQAAGPRSGYFNPYQSSNLGTGIQQQSQELTGFTHAMYHPPGSNDPFTSYNGHQYAVLDPNAPTFSTSQRPASRPNQGERSLGQDWTGNVQSLTLGGM
jgi:hypothetical protein